MATKKKKKTAVQKAMTKSQVFSEISEGTGLTKKQVSSVFEEMEDLIERHIKKRGIGHFTVPGLMKVKAVKRPARPARKNVPNPFKPGELMDIPAKPASMKVRVTPLKKLKEMVL